MSEVFEDRGRKVFPYHLSHLLHWRASAPERLEAYPVAQSEHLQSLYHTLLLRITINQITNDQQQQPDNVTVSTSPWTLQSNDSPAARYLRPTEMAGVQHNMKLLATCQAVVKSLNRTSMKHRSVLSWVTGYSAASAAFGLLFWIASQESERNSMSVQVGSLEGQASAQGPLAPATWQCYGEILDDALSVLATVGRQFSRMVHYHRIIHYLRDLMRAHVDTIQQEKIEEVATLISDIRVDHLRILAYDCLTLKGWRSRDLLST